MANENEKSSLTGLSAAEAQEFHKFFMQGILAFTATSLVAHVLIWMWRPWF